MRRLQAALERLDRHAEFSAMRELLEGLVKQPGYTFTIEKHDPDGRRAIDTFRLAEIHPSVVEQVQHAAATYRGEYTR